MTSTDHVEFYWFPHTDATLLKCNTRVPLEEGLRRCRAGGRCGTTRSSPTPRSPGVVAAGRRVPALVPPLARISARALGAAHVDRPLAPGLRQPAPRPLPGDGVRDPVRADAAAVLAELPPGARGERLAVGLPGRGAGGRRRRHPAVDGVRAGTPPTSPRTCPRATIPAPGSTRWSRSPARSAAARTGGSCTASTPTTCAPATRASTSSSPPGPARPGRRARQRLPRPGPGPGGRTPLTWRHPHPRRSPRTSPRPCAWTFTAPSFFSRKLA